MQDRSGGARWKWIAVAVLVLPAAAALATVLASTFASGDTIGPVRGLALGYGPAQARDRLVTDGAGSFRSTAIGEDFALDWTPRGAAGELKRARLEFHLGQLVAARLTLAPEAPEASGPEFELTETSVLTREVGEGGAVELTWLARSCPTHADEVERLIAERR
jgi:hypothetical protein